MTLVRIDLRAGKPPAYRAALTDAVHRALVEMIGIPLDDRLRVVSGHEADGPRYAPAP